MREIITNKVEEYLAREYWCSPSRLHAGGVVYEMIRRIDQPSIVPFIKVLREGAMEKFRDEVVRAMLERALQADGTCFETFRRIHVRADK